MASGILGHAKVDLAMDVCDHADVNDFRQSLSFLAGELLASVSKNAASA